MAGRYDHNPFEEEEEVNPFAVSSPFFFCFSLFKEKRWIGVIVLCMWN